MILKLDNIFNILFFKYNNISISWGISERIKYIKVLNYYDDGCIEFDTNIGIESIDIIYGNEDFYTKKQLKILKSLFQTKDLNIKVEVI